MIKVNCFFNKSEKWRIKEYNSYSVEIVHWTRRGRFDEFNNYNDKLLTHCWNVYVIVTKEHPVFDELTEDTLCCHKSLDSLHCGTTFCEWFRDKDGNVLTKKYGSDYLHYGDEMFELCSSEEDVYANRIFRDAYDLHKTFESLIQKKEEA